MTNAESTCELYSKAIAAGEDPSEVVGELAVLYGVQRPAIWRRLITGGLRPPYGHSEKRSRRKSRARRPSSEVEKERMAQPRVDRDPCQRCGVRRDIGCYHTRAPVGMVL